MPKGLLFLCCACCILILTIINLSIGPIISGKADSDGNIQWGTLNCGYYQDLYDENKKAHPEMTKEEKKYGYEWMIDCCKRKKGMHDMEYTAFIFDIVIGFVCSLMGLLHFLDIKKDFVEKTGLIGLCCGGVGFILTLVYAIFNGIVYTNYYDIDNIIVKRDGDGAFAELKGNEYESLYFDKKGNQHAFYAKYSDLIKKQYNYDKDYIESFSKDEISGCTVDFHCSEEDGKCGGTRSNTNDISKNCQFLYISPSNQVRGDITGITNRDISNRFLTVLILSLFVCLAYIGLCLFGFLMAKSGEF